MLDKQHPGFKRIGGNEGQNMEFSRNLIIQQPGKLV